jgi:hypothetical protein
MTWNTLETSLVKARERLGEAAERPGTRRRRSDASGVRLDPLVQAELERLLAGDERPAMTALLADLARTCRAHRRSAPSRATLYRFLGIAPGATFRVGDLPAAVQEVLHNLDGATRVPAHQVAFLCLNHGGTEALGYAAALPWLALYQAALYRGWRPRSRGLLEAIRRVRRI